MITITDGPGDATGATVENETTATFTFNADPPLEFGTSFQCTLSGGAPHACSSPYKVDAADLAAVNDGVPSGAFSLEVTAIGQNLLVEPEPALYEWTIVDTIAPETTDRVRRAGAHLGRPRAAAPHHLRLERGERDLRVLAQRRAVRRCAAPPDEQLQVNLEPGTYTLEVRAVDASENLNVDATPASVTFTVVGPPITTIETATAPTDPTTEVTATFTFDADQDNVTYICSLDEVGFTPCASPRSYTEADLSAEAIANGEPATALGDHSFRVIAINDFGLHEDPPALYEWTVELPLDTVDPTTTISGPTTTQLGLPATFVLSGTDNQTLSADLSFECTIDGGALESCGSPYEVTDLPLGPHTITAVAIDAAGNVDETPASHTWTVVAPLPPNTPVGTNVEVDLTLPGGAGTATLTFASVTTAGYTTVEALATPPALPAGYLTDGASYYDISTTAVFGEPVTLCIPYSGIADGARLLHHDGSEWVDVTLTDSGGVLCAEIGSLSPFAVVDSTPSVVPTTTIQTAPPASHVEPDRDLRVRLAAAEHARGAGGLRVRARHAAGRAALAGARASRSRSSRASSSASTSSSSARSTSSASSMPAPRATSGRSCRPRRRSIPGLPRPPSRSSPTSRSRRTTRSRPSSARSTAPLYGSCETPYHLEDLPSGEHELLVRAVNVAGGVDPTPDEWEWTISPTPDDDTTRRRSRRTTRPRRSRSRPTCPARPSSARSTGRSTTRS